MLSGMSEFKFREGGNHGQTAEGGCAFREKVGYTKGNLTAAGDFLPLFQFRNKQQILFLSWFAYAIRLTKEIPV